MALRSVHRLGLIIRNLSSFNHTFQLYLPEKETSSTFQLLLAEKTKLMNDKISDFMMHHYVTREPLLQSMNIENEEELEAFIKKGVEEGLSMLAINPETEEILSVVLSHEFKPNWVQLTREDTASRWKSEKLKRLMYFYTDVAESAKLFDQFQVDRILSVSYLATKENMCRTGITKYIGNQIRIYAVSAGYPILQFETTNQYTKQLVQSLGCTIKLELPYDSFTDESGKPWIENSPPPPHNKVAIGYCILDPKLEKFVNSK